MIVKTKLKICFFILNLDNLYNCLSLENNELRKTINNITHPRNGLIN